MAVASPTLIPRPPVIPLVLPRAPQVNPTTLPKLDRYPGRMDLRRDFQRDIEDLSDEETELEDAVRLSFTCETAITDKPPSYSLLDTQNRPWRYGIAGFTGSSPSDGIRRSWRRRMMCVVVISLLGILSF